MPKQKTHKGLKKRVKVTRNGKVMRGKAGKQHLNAHMSAKKKRKLRKKGQVSKADADKVKKLLGEK